ncbi:hypothetical protein OS493_026241, partial [Desmophyllum pertusum]
AWAACAHRDKNSIKNSSTVVQYKIHEKNVTCFAPECPRLFCSAEEITNGRQNDCTITALRWCCLACSPTNVLTEILDIQ